MATRASRGYIVVDTSDLKKFARELRSANRKTYLYMNRELRAAAGVIAQDAKDRASWSQKIPGTIRVTGGLNRMTIKAGNDSVPEALLYERGTAQSGGKFVRHPVWPRPKGKYDQRAGGERWPGKWAETPTRPFLRPAIVAHRDEVAGAMAEVVGGVLRGLGHKI